MNKHTLIEYSANWADEIDLNGYFILNENELKEFKEILAKIKRFNFHFGTNETMNYEDISHLVSDLKYKKISEQEYLMFKRLNLLNVGINPYYNLINYNEDNEEREEEVETQSSLYQAYVEEKDVPKVVVPTDEEIEILIARLKKNHS